MSAEKFEVPGTVESKEEVKEMEGQVGYLNFEAKVKVGADGEVSFAEDIDVETGTIMDEGDIQALFDAGILAKGNPDRLRSNYALAEGDENGYVKLDKDELNAALKSGKLKAEIDEEGDLSLHV